ncbi:pimeloyl-ACP methyl ester carboxylesterase [Umezawaea tangerina]|uniref:Pimeloyl-ACP methyl ester carboxylesterase n=1 Tax=Umezawaea tangerina TaxID=84725 RepID=A0A2T0T458_9PSEU|nr:pimeloyl-ACP methyl ester carboxylesterase [Umezawaea tangerina]
MPVFWLHGSPQTGDLLDPLLEAAFRRGIRLVGYDRPGYGGSTALVGRDIGAAAADVGAIADALGLERFAVAGHSGGGPHALACGVLLPGRVSAVASLSGPAPVSADGLDWFAHMAPGGEAELRAAMAGRAVLEEHLASAEFDPEVFTPADFAALEGPWASLGANAEAAMEAGLGGLVDDDLALVAPWGFDPARIAVPTLLVHGVRDRMVPSEHGEWMADAVRPHGELWLSPQDGHVSVLDRVGRVFDWLVGRS